MVRRFVAPRATAVELPKAAEVPLSVIAGRADAMGHHGHQRRRRQAEEVRTWATLSFRTPLFSFPAYVGVANEPDKRFRDFVHWWAE